MVLVYLISFNFLNKYNVLLSNVVFQTVFTVVSDSEIKEDEKTNFEDGKDRSFVITRKVNGDVMDVVSINILL